MNSDLKKKKAQLIEELDGMRQRVSELEAYKTSYLATEKELREGEEKLRLMFESVTDGITVTDLDGIITDVNKAVLELGGFDSESDVVGMSAFESIALRDRERALTDMLELRQRDVVDAGRYDLLRADGSEYPAEISAGLLRDAAGNPAGFVSVIRDITERKLAEEVLREGEERFRILVESTGDFIWEVDVNGVYTYCSPKIKELWGYTPEESIGKTPFERMIPEDRDRFVEIFRTLSESQSPLKGIESSSYDSDGRVVILETSGAPFYDADGRLLGYRGTSHDITERKQMEEAIRESEEKYRILVENSQDSIIIVDFEGTIQLANQASVQLSGYSLSEGIGMNIAEIVAPAYREEALKKLLEAKSGEPVPYFETAVQRKDGTVVTVEACGQAIFKDGKAVGVQIIARDITERKRAEEERQRIERLESLGTLAGGIAHDFNNILTGVMGNIGLALRYMDPDGRATQRLLEAEKASLRARDLTQQLLTFSKGSLPVKKNLAIGQLVEEAAGFALRGSNARFELALSHDIWPVNVDEGQVNGVISNLVINADEAMPQGGTIKIRVKNRVVRRVTTLPLSRGNYLEVIIEDRGVGIPKEHLGRIFEPYFTTKQKGSGLGLAAAYSIVKNHDGCITVESKLGVGTTFHVFLPASKESATVEKETSDESSAPGWGRILVMDDEEAIRQLLHRALTDVGYEVLLTGDGEEAIKQYAMAREAGAPFDAVIMDLTVPGKMGGREAIEKLLEIDPEVQAIASSGYSTDPVISDFRNYGFSGVVTKPYRISELRETLREVVARKLD